MLLDLPEADADATEHSGQLAETIIQRIQDSGGVIAFDEFMQALLYEPGLGYYSAETIKFGAQGDFVTAPEISPLFGYALGEQCLKLFQQGCAPCILEFGAGSGKLCAQILAASKSVEKYLILEVSGDLKLRQQNYLRQQLDSELFARVEWLNGMPEKFDGIVIANEVLDAMPVHILQRQQRWQELGVAWQAGRFAWQLYAEDSAAVRHIARIEASLGPLPEGYRSEVNLNYQPWLAALAQACDRVAVLLIDYGYEQQHYYHPERGSGTLLCHYQHRVHDDPLIYPGLQDVTAFVDFDALADAAEAAQFEICGLVSQARFLLANGLLQSAQRLAEGATDSIALAIAQQVKTLTLGEEMGEKFKVLALQKNIELDWPAMRRGLLHG